MAAVLLLAACSGGPAPEDQAADACQGFVSDRLKAPSTAEFTEVVAVREKGTANGWTALGVVDAENAFGAKIRSDFRCRMHTAGDRWVLEAVDGLD